MSIRLHYREQNRVQYYNEENQAVILFNYVLTRRKYRIPIIRHKFIFMLYIIPETQFHYNPLNVVTIP